MAVQIAPPAVKKGPAFTITACILAAIAILFVPIVFGGAGVLCAALGMRRKEKGAAVALIVAIVGTIVGLVFGAAMINMNSYG
jgi:hypothetical protein